MRTTYLALQGEHLVLSGFVHGIRFAKPPMRPLTDDDVQARCLWLSNRGRHEEAEILLDDWCSRQTRH